MPSPARGSTDPRPAGAGPEARRDVGAALGRLQLDPTPRGRATRNWRVLADVGSRDLVAARLAEAHLDAATTAAELGGRGPADGELWGVWAAEAEAMSLSAERRVDTATGWVLTGTKPWCSGRGIATHALVTAHAVDGRRLFLVALDATGVQAEPSDWGAAGMAGTSTGAMAFDGVDATDVGGPGAYLDRPGFWHGAVGVAAAWFGGAVGALGPLRKRVGRGRRDPERSDPHAAAHLGVADAALAAARAILAEAAAEIDRLPDEPVADAHRRALRVRAAVEAAVETVLRGVARATGPGPLVHDAGHARHVADLAIYVRQSHAERDLAALGDLAVDAPVRW